MLKSLRTAKAAAMALFLVGTAATLHARAEQGPIEQCVEMGDLAKTIAEARDNDMPLPEVLKILKKHDAPEAFSKIAVTIYSYPSLTPTDVAANFIAGCLKAKQI